MPTDTTAKQNIIIWSISSFVILILCGIIGWLVNGKDAQILASIKEIKEIQYKGMEKAEESDKRILEGMNKICERLGTVESRVSNLEIFIQMPFPQREKLFEKFRNGGSSGFEGHKTK